MSISIRRPLVPTARRPLAARLVACGAVLAVAAAAACQGPTEPQLPVTAVVARSLKQEAVVAAQTSLKDTAAVDTVITSPQERGFWW